MEKNGSFLSKFGLCLYGGLVAAVCMGIVFFPVLAKYSALIAPDAMPFFPYPWRTVKLGELLASGTFTPHSLYWLVFNPLYAHELTFAIDSFVLALAGVFYLRSQRVHPVAAWCGGLALGLSGYTFTLFCAGHRGYFHMFSCAVWAFGLIARGVETKRLSYFAMLGLVFAWGVPYQPDVLLLVGALAVAYVLWLTFSRGDSETQSSSQSAIGNQQPAIAPQKSKISNLKSKILTVWPRFLVSVLVLALAGFGGVRSAVTTQIAGREAQISGATGKAEKSGSEAGKMTAAEKRERWVFATNWSLPPEDVLEFVVPGLFGDESMQGAFPYWGRLGRPHDEVFQKGRMMPNYRGHTVYLGVIPVLLALLSVFAWVSQKRAKAVSAPHKDSALCPPASDSASLPSPFSDVPFWCAVWVVCLILAMGRYTPLYRLFYAIPYMDYIRAPVKFHHLVEIATAFLAGFGADAFLRAGGQGARRKLLWLGIGMSALLSVGALVALVARPAVARCITELGMGQMADALSGYALHNLMRAAGLSALVAGLAFVAVRRAGERVLVTLGCALLAVLALDQAWVARRYVKAMDIAPFYAENAVVKAVKKLAGGQTANVVNYATQNTWQDWFNSSLTMNGIRNRAPSQEEMGAAYGKVFLGLQKDPVRLWQVLHAQAVIVPHKGVEGLQRAGALRPLMNFELGSGSVRQTSVPGEKTLTLASVANGTKAMRWAADWQGDVPAEKQVDLLVSGTRTVSDAPAPAEAFAGEADVRVQTALGLPGAFATRVRVSSKGGGLLVFDERMTDKQEVLLDGKPARRYVADAVWPAALVPAGEHDVVLRAQRQPAVLLLSVLAALAVPGWCVGARLLQKRPHGIGEAA